MKFIGILLLSLFAAPTLTWADRGMPTCPDCRVTVVRRQNQIYYRITGVVRHGNDANVDFSTPLRVVLAVTALSITGGYLGTPEGAFVVEFNRASVSGKQSVNLVVGVIAPDLKTYTFRLPLP